jgi:hypothetical protein
MKGILQRVLLHVVCERELSANFVHMIINRPEAP